MIAAHGAEIVEPIRPLVQSGVNALSAHRSEVFLLIVDADDPPHLPVRCRCRPGHAQKGPAEQRPCVTGSFR